MDIFFGYNPIKIVLEDQEKTTFTCAQGTFFQNVMSFSLKNAGATYQRFIITIFHDMMHKIMEDYEDYTLFKSMQKNTHLMDLGPILDCMEKFNLWLNQKKCTFEVTSGKILGYIILAKGIKVDLEKIQDIMKMQPTYNK